MKKINISNRAYKLIPYAAIPVLIFLAALRFCNTPPSTPAPKIHTIAYRVDGTCEEASVTYTNFQGGMQQLGSVTLPWSVTESFTLQKEGNFLVQILAQNKTSEGSIIVTVYVDNKEVKTSRSEGEYVIAEATGYYYIKD